jgi:hypothetical protein
VSTATRNKLDAFQFSPEPNSKATAKQELISLLSSDDKENAGAEGTKVPKTVDFSGNKLSQPRLPQPAKKDGPSTPAGRLALPDLIGMGDVQRAVQDVSPEDRIEWGEMRMSNPSPPGKTTARKRARSSSPLASLPGQLTAFINTRAKVDSGSELWGRYALNGSNASTPPSVPALAHVMHTSSPQPEKGGKTPRSGSGFKRANSCGNHFPKRRKVLCTENDDVFTETVKIGPSKLSVLLERVQEGLSQPRRSPEISQPAAVTLELPQKRRHEDRQVSEDISSITYGSRNEIVAEPTVSSETSKAPTKQKAPTWSNSSDYGEFDDDELDASLLNIFDPVPEASISNSRIESKISQRPPDHPPRSRKESPKRCSADFRAAKGFKSDSSTLRDEFDESDEEMFAVDLEDIVAKFEMHSSVGGKNSPVLKAGGALEGDSDDEYGDGGLDEEDFEAAEAAATQSRGPTATSFLPVRGQFS